MMQSILSLSTNYKQQVPYLNRCRQVNYLQLLLHPDRLQEQDHMRKGGRPDASGTYVGSSYVNATARNYARFGLLYCNNGVWNGERILPADWVRQTTTPFAADPLKHYGYQFWLSGFYKDNPAKRKYPVVPSDMFYFNGFSFEMVYIIPSKKLEAVRLGLTLERSFEENNFLKSLLAAIDNN